MGLIAVRSDKLGFCGFEHQTKMDAEISRSPGCLVKKVHGHFELTVSFGRNALVMFLANKKKRASEYGAIHFNVQCACYHAKRVFRVVF
jgi:hypothetical protein